MYIKNYVHCCFSKDSTNFFSSWALAPTHIKIFIRGLSTLLSSTLITSIFLVSKGLSYFYNKPNNTWLLVDMEFLLSCLTRRVTRELWSWALKKKFHIYARLCLQTSALWCISASFYLSICICPSAGVFIFFDL